MTAFLMKARQATPVGGKTQGGYTVKLVGGKRTYTKEIGEAVRRANKEQLGLFDKPAKPKEPEKIVVEGGYLTKDPKYDTYTAYTESGTLLGTVKARPVAETIVRDRAKKDKPTGKAELEKDPSGYHLKWQVKVDGQMVHRYAAKRDAQAHVDMIHGDFSKAPEVYKRQFDKAKKAGDSDSEAVRGAVMWAQVIGLKPGHVNADPETGIPIEAEVKPTEAAQPEHDPDRPDPAAVHAYEEKREEKRERFEIRAEKARAKAAGHFDRADMREEKSGIPMGQPILVGHHSEKRHRRALDRADRNMRAGIGAEKKAEHYERRASGMSTAISADDPAAVVKLKQKLAKMQEQREGYKRVNKVIKKKGATPESIAAALGWKIETARKALEPDFAGRIGFPSYVLTNLGANIRRVQQRIEAMRKENTREEAAPVAGEGYRVEEDKADNRIRIFTDGKPSKEIRTMFKRAGLRWAPSVGAWQRQLTANGRYAVEQVIKEAFPQPDPEPTGAAPAESDHIGEDEDNHPAEPDNHPVVTASGKSIPLEPKPLYYFNRIGWDEQDHRDAAAEFKRLSLTSAWETVGYVGSHLLRMHEALADVRRERAAGFSGDYSLKQAAKAQKSAKFEAKGQAAMGNNVEKAATGGLRGTPIGSKTPSGKYIRTGKEEYTRVDEYNLKVEGKGHKEVAAKIKNGIEEAADLCKVNPPVCKGNMGIPRSFMPQISGEIENKFLAHLKSKGVSVAPGNFPAGKLMATQREILADKSIGMAQSYKEKKHDPRTGKPFDPTKGNILISREGHILDGHHRYAAALMVNPGAQMEVTKIDLPIKEILTQALNFPGVTQADMEGNPVIGQKDEALKYIKGAKAGDVKKSMTGIDAMGAMVKAAEPIIAQPDAIDDLRESLEKGAGIVGDRDLGQEVLIEEQAAPIDAAAAAIDMDKAQPSASTSLTPQKARQMLHERSGGHGREITEQQQKFFGAVGGHLPAPGEAKKSMNGIDAMGEFLEKATNVGESVTNPTYKNLGEAGALPGDNAAGAGGLPHSETQYTSKGPEDGGPLDSVGKPGGSPDSHDSPASAQPGDMLSDDDAPAEAQMANQPEWDKQRGGAQRMMGRYKKSDLPEGTRLTPAAQADMVGHERAAFVTQLQKAKYADVSVGMGVSPQPVPESESLEKAIHIRQGDMVHMSNESDLAVERMQKQSDFYHGAPPGIDYTGTLRKSVQCSNGHSTPAYLSSCVECGVGSQLATPAGAGMSMAKSGRGLTRLYEPDLDLSQGLVIPDQE